MKLRPLLMKYYMVWAILQDFKTETRRFKNPSKMEAGDKFWIKEPWKYASDSSLRKFYKADWTPYIGQTEGWKWNPSLFMPKAASRLILNLAEIREERLGDITEAGAIAEGIEAFRDYEMKMWNIWPCFKKNGEIGKVLQYLNPIGSFKTLWDSIGKNDWMKDQDKTVWVYRWDSFEEIK